MMTRSPPVMGLCLTAAIGVHLVGFAQLRTDNIPLIAAASAPAEAKMGASFADLAAGVLQPVQTATRSGSMHPGITPRLAIRPDIAGTARVVPTPSPATSATADTIAPRVSTTAQPPAAEAPSPQRPTTRVPIRPTQQLQAQALAAPTRSLRPIARPTRGQGNASQNAVAGASSSASRTATATQSGSNAIAQRTAAQSNAAATANYAGIVLQQIANVRRRRTPESGVAVVAFTIGGNGNLTSISILRSSGNRQVDRFAQQVIRRAAPFPPPPTGGRTHWQVEIEDR